MGSCLNSRMLRLSGYLDPEMVKVREPGQDKRSVQRIEPVSFSSNWKIPCPAEQSFGFVCGDETARSLMPVPLL